MKKKYNKPTEFDRYVHHEIWDEVLRQAIERNVGFCVSKIEREVTTRIFCDVFDDEEKVKRINEICGNASCVLCTLSSGGCQFCRTLGLSLDGKCLGGLYDKACLGNIEAIKTIRNLI